MAKTVYFSHGDKGGVGKSMMSALLVEYFLENGEKVAIIEGDINAPDIARRYRPIGVPGAGVNLARAGASEEAVVRFINSIEELAEHEHIVVNLPAAASETLDANGDVIAGGLSEIGFDMCVMYSIGQTNESVESFKGSAQSGLFSVASPAKQVVVYPMFCGDPNDFAFVKTGMRDKYSFQHEITVPAIQPATLVSKVLALPGAFSDLASGKSPGLSTGERLMFAKRFFRPAMDSIAKVFTLSTQETQGEAA